ncbi:unnamed protein product [Phytophthora fragariaefolia]|uniref:Unnamed protein product n=1 Tax=Phytophthora fragariaefolia TaxID=1490495 RepID=A0A9W7CX34_9STRA|nr:unnamed protein product [Phytophthora fragariaefolia]
MFITSRSRYIVMDFIRATRSNQTGESFPAASEATSRRIEEEVEREFADDSIDRCACIVTNEWVFRRDAYRIAINDLPLASMPRVLAPKAWDTVPIQGYYDCSALDHQLSGMLLSSRGLEQADDGMKAWISCDAL